MFPTSHTVGTFVLPAGKHCATPMRTPGDNLLMSLEQRFFLPDWQHEQLSSRRRRTHREQEVVQQKTRNSEAIIDTSPRQRTAGSNILQRHVPMRLFKHGRRYCLLFFSFSDCSQDFQNPEVTVYWQRSYLKPAFHSSGLIAFIQKLAQ